jgi:gamma-D-glutamyl-L-lysine dipeptidyl-peptidase
MVNGEWSIVPTRCKIGQQGKRNFFTIDHSHLYLRCRERKFAQSKTKKMGQPAICLLSVAPMRKEPSHRSEMVSQLLFGEYVEMGEEKDDFIHVRCVYDDYEGWVQMTQLTPVSTEQIFSTNEYIGLFGGEVSVDGRCRLMPFATPVYHAEKAGEPLRFGHHQVLYRSLERARWNSKEKELTKENLAPVVDLFLDTPYLWGGKSVYGIDCSGFVQQVFKLFGVKLLRDAYLQATQGHVVESIEEARLGDLAFFRNEAGKIVHVGIVLDDKTIVHASGNVRVDGLDKEGIVHSETKKQTHRLHSIKRFF